jgi:hypothetical protein
MRHNKKAGASDDHDQSSDALGCSRCKYGHLLNLPDEILRQVPIDDIRALQGDAVKA